MFKYSWSTWAASLFHVEHLESILACPICGSEDISSAHQIKDHMVSQEVFTVVGCSQCGMKRTSPRPNTSSIGRYYESDAYKSHNDDGGGLFDAIYHVTRNWAAGKKARFLDSVSPLKSKIPALLDVGCGIGVFLEAAKKQNWGVFGVEISENARKQAEKRLNQPVFEKIEALPNEQKFDGISLFHVLEHLPEPKGTLEVLLEKAQPGAPLILALPNYESWDAKHYGADWAAWDVPIHFWHFRKEDVQALAHATGWDLESIHPMPLDAYYVSLLSESFQKGRKRWIAASLKGFWSNLRGGKHNTSSLIYVLRKPS